VVKFPEDHQTKSSAREMSRGTWQDDESTMTCTKCRAEFGVTRFKHHCRKCGFIFCDNCTSSRLLIPAEELVPRPATWMNKNIPDVGQGGYDEDNFRIPQRVCDQCSHSLRMIQGELRIAVGKYNQEMYVDYNPMVPSLPAVQFKLDQEISKAVIMLHNFRTTQGEEKIPRELLDLARGVVFLTIVKVGFMFTGRYGTGLVVAKLHDGTWSAPSAIMLTGLGWGLQIGAEVTDVMLILSTDAAVDAFKSRAQVSVGAELGVSVGPIGRSIGSDVTAGNKGAAHAFSYAHSKGLFFGASLEAAGIAARKDVNRAFYGEDVSISALLSGEYPRPRAADAMYRILNELMHETRMSSTSSGYGQTSTVRDYSRAFGNMVDSSNRVFSSSPAASSNPATASPSNSSYPQPSYMSQANPSRPKANEFELEDSEGHYL
jgi:SH3 domain-containing YSC84-like protein 1